MSGQRQPINAQALRDNLKELDRISAGLLNEMAGKNKAAEQGLADCASCRRYLTSTPGTKY